MINISIDNKQNRHDFVIEYEVNQIKTYNKVNRYDDSLSFRISRMEDIYTDRSGKMDNPHRHNYFTVILTVKAAGKHVIDFNEFKLSDKQLFFVNPDQIHQVIEYCKPKGYGILFSPQFLAENNIPLSFIYDLNLFNDFENYTPLIFRDRELYKLVSIAEEMISITQTDIVFKNEALGALLKLLLIQSHNLCSFSKKTPHIIEARNSILRRFKDLINENFEKWHSAVQYANELNITPDHLNKTIKSLTGKTAKEHIHTRLIIAAKRMCYFSELSSKEIGYRLGFTEPANFSAFFKKHTGLSPSEFSREKAKL
jgi:AraC-like DNA-binding protein